MLSAAPRPQHDDSSELPWCRQASVTNRDANLEVQLPRADELRSLARVLRHTVHCGNANATTPPATSFANTTVVTCVVVALETVKSPMAVVTVPVAKKRTRVLAVGVTMKPLV